MKLSDRIKRKMMGVNLSSVAFFAVSMIAITLAWFAYTNTISSNFNVNLKTWDIKITKNNTEVTNTFTVNINDVYPGMTDFSETYSIKNNGDIPAKISYNVTYFRVFDNEITLNNDVSFYEIERDYPFKINFDYDSRYLAQAATRNFTVSCTWPLDSGNDELDTQYGNMAYTFNQQHSSSPLPGIEIRIEIVVSQFVNDANSFATDSWDTIQMAIESGNANSKYSVGDTKTVSVNGNNYTVRIANKSTLAYCNGSTYSKTACGWVFEFSGVITQKKYNNTDTNVGGYPSTLVYSYLKNDLFSQLPYDLRKVIATTKVVSGHGSGDSSNFISYDKLYLLSVKEVYGSNTADTAANNTRQLEYYSNNGVTESNCSGAIKNNHIWWLRTAHSDNASSYKDVFAQGYLHGDGASAISIYVSPAFRIT